MKPTKTTKATKPTKPTKTTKPSKTEKSAPPVNKDETTVYISNLSYKLNRDNLKNIFSNFGEVKQVKLVMDMETQKSKGMAFIRMGDISQVIKAIKELNGQIIDGRTVKVSRAIPMKTSSVPEYKEEREEKSSPSKALIEKKKKKGPVALKDFLEQKARSQKK